MIYDVIIPFTMDSGSLSCSGLVRSLKVYLSAREKTFPFVSWVNRYHDWILDVGKQNFNIKETILTTKETLVLPLLERIHQDNEQCF